MLSTRRLELVALSLIVATLLLGGTVLAAGQAAPGVGLVGQEGGESRAVAFQANHAYLGVGPRLAVLDVSVPGTPVLTGQSAPLADVVMGVAVSGGYAYVADGQSGLEIVDVTNPLAPSNKGSLDTPGSAQNVAISGTHAYVADLGGLRIVNVSNPLAPTEVAAVVSPTLAGDVKGVALAGQYAYVGAGAAGLVILDVTPPSAPSVTGAYTQGLVAENVVISGTFAYVVDSGLGVIALDVSTPSAPAAVDLEYLTSSSPHDLYRDGLYLYVTVGDFGVDVFQINPDGTLTFQYTHDTPGVANDVAVSGSYAYVADGPSNLRVVDVLSLIGSPVEVGFYQTLGDALGLDASGTHAYVAAGINGLSVMDVSDLTNPQQAGSVDTPGYAQAVAVSGTLAFVADGGSGLAIADVSTPANPTSVVQLPLPGDARSIALQGGYAYVVATSEGLQIVDVSDPNNPSAASAFTLTGESVWDVAVDGNYAYLAGGTSGLHVIDISNPLLPTAAAVLDTPGFAFAVSLAGGYAYIADVEGGLVIANVMTPTSPTPVTAFTGTLGEVLGVTISGRHALLTNPTSVHIVDVSSPASPVLRASYDTAGTPQDVAVTGAVLVTDFDGGLRVLNPADVAVSVATTAGPLTVYHPFTYTVTVGNYGPSLATGIHLTGTLPSGVAFVAASPACSQAGGTVSCNIGSLALGATSPVTITVTPSGAGVLAASFIVSSGTTDFNALNDAATSSVAVVNPAPAISAISPASVVVNHAGFTLVVTGTDFLNSSVVLWNGGLRTTGFVNTTQLTATITAGDVANAGPQTVTVFNPAPAGGTSNPLTFTVVQGNTQLGLASSPNPSLFGSPVAITATVTQAPTGLQALPGGPVTFNHAGAAIAGCAAVDLNLSQQAVCTTSALPVGTNAITATYSGDANFNPMVSSVLLQVVDDVPITGLSAANSSPTTLHSSTVFTATVTAGSNIAYTWDFGDSSPTATGSVVTHTYANFGSYTAAVTATNTANSANATTAVTVYRPTYLPLIQR